MESPRQLPNAFYWLLFQELGKGGSTLCVKENHIWDHSFAVSWRLSPFNCFPLEGQVDTERPWEG